MQKITPFLWFNNQAEEAMYFYMSIFKQAKVKNVMRYGTAGPGPIGSVMSATFDLEGQEFMVINGGPIYAITPGISFFIHCQTQDEVDHYWQRLSAGGHPSRCGWLTDKFGVTWQIIPDALGKLLGDENPAKAASVMQAMLQMDKIEISKLQEAADKA
jgi:predicted 3-demethylubiquinone-9 3-methyltransferase (glyoxalase superfamily)